MVRPLNVTAVIPTRGNVDMSPVVETLDALDEVIVWDNSAGFDFGVFGRYYAAGNARNDVILTLDDDIILPRASVAALLDQYTPGFVVCNVPDRFRTRYTDSGLVGFGAIYDRELAPTAFEKYANAGGRPSSDEFRRTCDLVLTMLSPLRFVDVPYEELPYARDDDRMWRQRGHFEEREGMRAFLRQIRAAA